MAKIIIIGAGISGLSTYLFLRRYLLLSNPTPSSHAEQQRQGQYEIKIYEAYDIHQSHFNASLTNPTNPTTSNSNSDEVSTANTIPAGDTDPIFTPQAIGSAIGIARNGLNVLARLDELHDDQSVSCGLRPSSLIEEMAVHGHPIERWELGTARGFTLGEVNLARPGNASLNKHDHSKVPTSTKRNPCPYHGIMIARQSCWEILRDRVLKESPDVVIRKKIIDVIIGDEETFNIVKFEDGSQEEADLVIGADGLRSVLRRAMFRKGKGDSDLATTAGRAQTHKGLSPSQTREATPSWLWTILSYLPIPFFNSGRTAGPKAAQRDYISPQYEGLVGVGGFVPSSVLQATGHKPGTMTVVFGPNGFFGYGYLTSSASAPSRASSSNDGTRARETDDPAPATTPAPSIPAPGLLAGWWSTCSSPDPFPYSTSPSPPPSQSPSPSTGGVPNTNTSTSTNTNAATDHGTSTTRKPTEVNKQLALSALLSRHRKWHNPAIQAILSFVQEDTEQQHQHQYQHQDQHQQSQYQDQGQDQSHHFNHTLLRGKALDAAYPTWTTPELPYWSLRGRAVLVGDAAHALQPSSGQGASQALEDAEVLAVFLSRSLGTTGPSPPSSRSEAASPPKPTPASASAPAPLLPNATTLPHASLTQALRAFESSRMPRVHAIHTRSQRMSRMKADMGPLAEWAMYIAIYLGTWFRSGDANGEGEGGETDERYYERLFAE